MSDTNNTPTSLKAAFGEAARDIKSIIHLFEQENGTDLDRTILSNSLFYSNSGLDPTPVISFGAGIPLYIYVDTLENEESDFKSTVRKMYAKIKKAGYSWKKAYQCRQMGRVKHAENAEITQWYDMNNNPFHIIYIKDGSEAMCRSIFDANDDSKAYKNFVQPKFVCNLTTKTETSGLQYYRVFDIIQQHAEYILGHCEDNKYICVSEVDYYGDKKGTADKIPVYQRMYSYVF